MKKSIKFFSFTLVFMMCCIFGGSLHVKAGSYENVMTPQLAVIKSLVGNVRKSQISKEKMLLISKLISAKEKTAAVELCDQYLKELGFSENELQTFSNETKIAMFSEGEIETVSSYLSITEEGIIATIPQSTVDAVNPELLFPILEGGSEGDYNNAAWSANNGIIKVTIMCTYQRSQSEKGWYSFYSIYTWIVYQKHLDNMFDIDMYDASGIDWSTNSTDYSSTLRYDLGTNANTITQTTSGRTLTTSKVSYAWTIPMRT